VKQIVAGRARTFRISRVTSGAVNVVLQRILDNSTAVGALFFTLSYRKKKGRKVFARQATITLKGAVFMSNADYPSSCKR